MTLDLNSTLTYGIITLMLVFARAGAIFLIMPGVGDMFVPARIRLFMALSFSFVLAPTASLALRQPIEALLMPETGEGNPFILMTLLVTEATLGLFIGLIGRFMIGSLNMAGTLIAQNMGLANAFIFNPSLASQGAVVGTFLSMAGISLILISNMHHVIFAALMKSYTLFPPNLPTAAPFPTEGLYQAIVMLTAESFAIGLYLAMPFVVVGLLFNVGLGLLSRLMPQIQVFFIATPAQLMLGFIILMTTMATMLEFWLVKFEDMHINLLGG